MESGNLLTFGLVGVGGYLAYQWYYGPGGYADQQACGAANTTAAQLQALASQVIAAAAASGVTPAAYLTSIAASTNAQTLACARVAIAQYPTAAASSTTAAATTSTVATPAATPAAPVTPTPVTPAAPSSLDATYASLKSLAATDTYFTGSGDALTSDVNHWNYYLAQLLGTAGPTIPGGMFNNVSGDDQNNLTAAQYWAVMAPWLSSTAGLSGLGIYGGLGAIVRRNRRR